MASLPCSKNSNNQILSRLIKTTYLFAKNNPIIFTRADKGNITVALNRDDYISKVNNMLLDTNTYIVNRDPTPSLVRKTQVILKNWKKREYISRSTENCIAVMGHCRESMHLLRVCSLE